MTDEIITGDCLEVLKGFAAESVDQIVTDPPYGISFMGKDWDKAIPKVEIWRECFRVLKAGAFAFVMCAPRLDVQSQMAVRLQAAAFRIDFSPIIWAFASGFPKSENISKAVDKSLGFEREVIGEYLAPDGRRRHFETHKPHKEVGNESHEWGLESSGFAVPRTVPASPGAKALDGSYGGFQPKPAVEIIIVAMKPLSEKTYVEQALKNRKGITWLDEGRIPFEGENLSRPFNSSETEHLYGQYGIFGNPNNPSDTLKGRFPANLLVSDDVLNDGTISKSSAVGFENVGWKHSGNTKDEMTPLTWQQAYEDSGSFSRYFSLDAWFENKIKELPEAVRKTFPFLIEPKASKEERNEGLEGFEEVIAGSTNFADKGFGEKDGHKHLPVKTLNRHPTVKPIQLMSYLITLGSRENDLILDPFCGSGSTCIAARILSRKFVGIEINPEYAEIARARIKLHQEQMKLSEA